MSNENATNTPASDTTSQTAPHRPPSPPAQSGSPGAGDAPVDREKARKDAERRATDDLLKGVPAGVSDADYLARQSAQARAAIAAVIGDMKAAVGDAANLKEWTRQHPWLVGAGAAAAGFVAGMLVTPSKDESVKEFLDKKWGALREKLRPADDDATHEAPEAATRKPKSQQPSAVSILIKEAMKVIGPSLGGMITGAFAGQVAAPDDDTHAGNGHTTPPPAPPGN